MNRDQTIRKIQRCLRLAASSNPHEAAAALRQARKLMDQYGLTEVDAAAAEINEAEAPTRSAGSTPPRSVVWLANLVGDGYRCEPVITCRVDPFLGRGRTTVKFYGAGADPQIAAYAFAVLRRQLESDKAAHTKRIRKRANKEARGEEFAFGWLAAVAKLFPREELPAEHGAAIKAAINERNGELRKSAGREVGKNGRVSDGDRYAGYRAGRNAQVNPGLAESGQHRLEQGLH